MKRILILNGAGKVNGNTARMINAFSEAAAANGNEIREFALQKMEIHGCLDCQGCARKPRESPIPCVQQDDMTQIYEAFLWADVVVFATPTYFWDISGVLKTAIDRLYAFPRNWGNAATRKDYALLMTSGGSTIDHMMDWAQNFERWMGWKNLGYAMNDLQAAAEIGASIQ